MYSIANENLNYWWTDFWKPNIIAHSQIVLFIILISACLGKRFNFIHRELLKLKLYKAAATKIDLCKNTGTTNYRCSLKQLNTSTDLKHCTIALTVNQGYIHCSTIILYHEEKLIVYNHFNVMSTNIYICIRIYTRSTAPMQH